MPVRKKILNPERIRSIPRNFGWVDRRLRSEGYLERLSQEALLLYFFLIIVADRDGVSFYGDGTVTRLLRWRIETLKEARYELTGSDLIAYRHPFYQVLSLPERHEAPSTRDEERVRGSEGPASLGDILKAALEKAVG